MSVERKGDAQIRTALLFNNHIYITGDIVEVDVYDSQNDSVNTFVGRIKHIDASGIYITFDVSKLYNSEERKICPINILDVRR